MYAPSVDSDITKAHAFTDHARTPARVPRRESRESGCRTFCGLKPCSALARQRPCPFGPQRQAVLARTADKGGSGTASNRPRGLLATRAERCGSRSRLRRALLHLLWRRHRGRRALRARRGRRRGRRGGGGDVRAPLLGRGAGQRLRGARQRLRRLRRGELRAPRACSGGGRAGGGGGGGRRGGHGPDCAARALRRRRGAEAARHRRRRGARGLSGALSGTLSEVACEFPAEIDDGDLVTRCRSRRC